MLHTCKPRKELGEKVLFSPTVFWNHVENTIVCAGFVKHGLAGSRKNGYKLKQNSAEKNQNQSSIVTITPQYSGDSGVMKCRSREYLSTTGTSLCFTTDENELQNFFWLVYVMPFPPILKSFLYSV